MTNSKFISNTAVLSEWYIIATKPRHRKYHHALISRDFFMNSFRRNIMSAELTAGKDPAGYTLPSGQSISLQWSKSTVTHSLYATLAWGKKWLQPLNPEHATQSTGTYSPTPSILFFLPCYSESRRINAWEVMPHLWSRPWDLSALSNGAVTSFLDLPVPLHSDNRTAWPHVVSTYYALVGNPSCLVVFVFQRLIDVLNWIS